MSALTGTKFVITLDTDTQLPRDAAKQFVGAMMHPLNRPHFDEEKKMVTSGYGILQPRVGVSLPGTNLSRYAALHGNDAGIDPFGPSDESEPDISALIARVQQHHPLLTP